MQLVDTTGQLTQRDLRSLLFQYLYAMEGFDYDTPLQTIVQNFNEGFELEIVSDSPVVAVAQEIIDKRDSLDQEMIPFLSNWRLERLGLCTKLILRLGIWELLNTDTDHKIIINESIELAKAFAEKDAYKFVNGVLDEFHKARSK